MIPSFAESMSGLPSGKKKTRRGRGRGPKPAASHAEHHAKIGAALEAGDHAAARSHAFALIKSLPSTAKNPSGVDDATNEPVTAPTPTAPAASGPSGAAKLANLLRSKKK